MMEKDEQGETAGADKDYEAELHAIVDAADIPAMSKKRLRGLKKEELLREIVDNVGKRGTGAQDLQNVISVAMLSEGWDAKNVTHIMGLRAFTSQLLCEQVVGRGLRRVGYAPDATGFSLPDAGNTCGVPLSIFRDVPGCGDPPPATNPPRTNAERTVLMKGAESAAIGAPDEVITRATLEAVFETTLAVGRIEATGAAFVVPEVKKRPAPRD